MGGNFEIQVFHPDVANTAAGVNNLKAPAPTNVLKGLKMHFGQNEIILQGTTITVNGQTQTELPIE